MKTAFLYGRELVQRDSRSDEIFGPTRLEYTFQLLESYKAFEIEDSFLIPPEDASERDLLSFHAPDYVEAVRRLSNGEKIPNPGRYDFSQSGDNPPYPGMYELAKLVVGSSLKAADLLLNGIVDVVFNSAGGLHHAAPDRASGFCIFNDAVIVIQRLLSKGMRVAYVDIDAHHGDGVQDAFYATDQVLTISLHQSGRYLFPGTGETAELGVGAGKGYSVNVPLAPFTGDATYLWAFHELVPPLIASYRPDILVSQLGCDTHYLDPLTQLQLTTFGYEEVVRKLKVLAPKWLALGGGGYEPSVVTRCWTLAYGIMLGRDWPNEIPETFQELYGLKELRDNEGPRLGARARDHSRSFAQQSVADVKKLVFPLHHLA